MGKVVDLFSGNEIPQERRIDYSGSAFVCSECDCMTFFVTMDGIICAQCKNFNSYEYLSELSEHINDTNG